MRKLGMLSVVASLAGLGEPIPLIRSNVSRVAQHYGSSGRKTTYHRPHGQRERTRRMRQIAAGSLRVENGLVALPNVEKLNLSSAYGRTNA